MDMKESYGDTKKQHYVPQTYLQGFKSCERKGKDYIFSHDKYNNELNREVQISKVAFEKYLYEFKDNDNNIIYKNYIESCLSKYEKSFNEYKKKAFMSFANYSSITNEEKEYWLDFITLQLLRTPVAFDVSTKYYKFDDRNDLTENEKKNYLLCTHFPFLDDESNPNSLFIDIRNNVIKKMYFQIMFVPREEDFLITSDNPINVVPNLEHDSYLMPYEMIIFPLNPRFGLTLSKESLFEGSDDRMKTVHKYVDKFNGLIYCSAKRFVYSNRTLSDEFVKKIKSSFAGIQN